MADQSPELLRETPTNVVTSEAPRGYLSSGQIEAPFRDASALLDKMGQTADAFEVPAAERQAASDLANQKVVRSPDGSVNVLNPASAMLFGDAGRAYSKAIQSGTADQIMAQVRPDLAAIHAQSPLDSAQVAKNNDAYFTKLATSTSGMGVIGEEVMKQARDIGSQHQGMAVTAGANNEIENTKKSILATLEDSKNTLSGMAAVPGKPNTPEYQAAVKNYNDSLDKLGTNDLFKMPAAYLATQRKEFMGELQATQAGAQIDSIFDKRGKAAAQQEALKILQNPDIPPEKANLLYRQTMSRLEYRTNDVSASQKAAGQTVSTIAEMLQKGPGVPGGIAASDPRVAAALGQVHESGNADAEAQLRALIQIHKGAQAVQALPASQQPAALGVPNVNARPMTYDSASGRVVFKDTGLPATDAEVRASTMSPAELAKGAPTREQASGPQYAADSASGVARIANAIHGQESGGRANSVTSVDGAVGGWQTTPGFFKTYARPGENINNPADNEAVARRGIADIHAKVGGDPARVAVAYFSGLGNVAPPGSPTPWKNDAKDGNGKSVSSYVGDVMKRLGQPMPAPPISANGLPFSESEGRANPWLYSEYFKSVAQDKGVRDEAFGSYESGARLSLKAGILPTDDTMNAIAQLSTTKPEYAEKASEVFGMVTALKQSLNGGSGGVAMSAPQMAAAEQEWLQKAQSAPDHLHQVLATSAYDYFKEQEKRAAESPMQDASRRYKQKAPDPIDPSNPGALPDNIAYRGALAQHYAALNASPAPSIFDKDDLPQVKSILDSPDLAAKAQVYGAIANLPEAVRGATLKALGGNGPKAMAEAAAGSLMKEAPEVAKSIFKGQGVIETDKRFDPEGEGQQKVNYQAGLDDALPRSLFTKDDLRNPAGSYATTEQMIRYRYADLSSQVSDKPPTAFSPDRLKQATDDVTGGVLSHNGGALIAPVRGMTQDAFDATVRGVSDSDLQGAMTLKGEKVTADYLHNTATLESAGDGKYFVKLDNNPSRPVYAYRQPQLPPDGDGKWGKFVLDLRNIKPSTQPYSPAPSVFAPPM